MARNYDDSASLKQQCIQCRVLCADSKTSVRRSASRKMPCIIHTRARAAMRRIMVFMTNYAHTFAPYRGAAFGRRIAVAINIVRRHQFCGSRCDAMHETDAEQTLRWTKKRATLKYNTYVPMMHRIFAATRRRRSAGREWKSRNARHNKRFSITHTRRIVVLRLGLWWVPTERQQVEKIMPILGAISNR